MGTAKSILDQKMQIKWDARLVLMVPRVCSGHAIDLNVFLDTNQNEEKDMINSTKKDIPTSMTAIYRYERYHNTIVDWCGM